MIHLSAPELKTALTKIRILSTQPRWDIYNLNKHDSVSSHSWFVAYYSMIFADMERHLAPDSTLDVEKILRMAVLHDTAESCTGDVNKIVKKWIIKETTDPLTGLSVMDKIEEAVAGMIFGGAAPFYYPYISAVDTQDSPEARIVKAADTFECIVYLQDCKERGQMSTYDLIAECVGGFRKYAAGFEFSPLVQYAIGIHDVADQNMPDTPGRV